MIYIGSTINLNKRFRIYWDNQFNINPCKKDTNNYKKEYRDDCLIREIELLKEYQKKYGRLPKCNDKIPKKIKPSILISLSSIFLVYTITFLFIGKNFV